MYHLNNIEHQENTNKYYNDFLVYFELEKKFKQ